MTLNARPDHVEISSRSRTSAYTWLLLTLATAFHGVLSIAQTQLPLAGSDAAFKILVFSKTVAFRHPSIPAALQAITTLGNLNNFSVTASENASDFNDANLAQFKAVVFLSTSGDVLDSDQQASFERYIRAGNGFVGIHSASDTEYAWPWYGGLVGAYFSSHPPIAPAVIHAEDTSDLSTEFLPDVWTRTEEWYDFSKNPRPDVHVLLTLDETTYAGGKMGDHPISWRHDYDGGRSWYTALGHAATAYDEPWFRLHILGGIRYAAGVPLTPPKGARVLFDGSNTDHWVQSTTKGRIGWPIKDGALEVDLSAGSIETVETVQDFRLHVEFQLPTYAPGIAEGQMPNSGVYLQRRYEIQILSSYGRPIANANDSGAIYGIKDAASNPSVPDGKWETFDIIFQSARWSGPAKTANARVTVYWNTKLVQDNVAILKPTGAGDPEAPTPLPVFLQALTGPVRFRNIWLKGAIGNPPNMNVVKSGDSLDLSWPSIPNGFTLESKPELGGGSAWSSVPTVPVTSNGRNHVLIPFALPGSFYRLNDGQ